MLAVLPWISSSRSRITGRTRKALMMSPGMPNGFKTRDHKGREGARSAPSAFCLLLSLGRFVQRGKLTRLGEAPEGVLLDLADTLGADAQTAAGLAERSGLLAAEAEAQPDDVTLTLRQAHDGLLDGGRAGVLDDLV